MKNITHDEALNLLESCPIAMLLIGEDNSIRGCNAAFTALTGVSAEALEGDLQKGLLAPLLGDESAVSWAMPNGEERHLNIDWVTVGERGVVARCYLDVTEIQRLKNERDALSTEIGELSLKHDRMISLLSRHGILVSLAPLVARSRRYNSPLSILTISVSADDDRDAMLQRIALLLKDQTRWADLIGCDNEGNFILVLQEASHDAAMQLVSKLAARLDRLNESAEMDVTASYGIAQCNKNDDAISLLERAEAALVDAQSSDDHTSLAL